MVDQNQLKNLLHRKGLRQRDKLLLILAVGSRKPKRVQEIKSLGRGAGLMQVTRWNVSRVLGTAKGLAIRVPQGWELTDQGREAAASLAGVRVKGAAAAKVAQDLREHLEQVNDESTRSFVAEAVSCFEHNEYRAAVVLSWVGAVSVLRQLVKHTHLASFNKEASRRNPKWRKARTADDLGRMKEHEFLDVLEAIGVLGNNVKQELQNSCLKLRNSCGHPSSLRLSENRVAAHVEILILNVFSKFV